MPDWWPDGRIPIYGFGMMLFITFLVTTWLASWRARKEKIAPQHLQDLAIWIFIGGLVGARITFMIQYGVPLSHFFMIWQGGLVFYGSAIGGVAGYFLAYIFVIRKQGLSTWKLADIIAPCVAIGLCLGRVGCLLNGCCYGNVACSHCPQITFPLSSPARLSVVERGLQTPAGFVMDPHVSQARVAAVEPESPAEKSGLQRGDVIVEADAKPIRSSQNLEDYLQKDWPRGKTDLQLTVLREKPGHSDAEKTETLPLPPMAPHTLGLHPTQIYESISTALLFLLLMAFYPLRSRDGLVMVLFILGYSVHRFLNEMLRNDTDPVAFGMTLSQNGSIFFFLVGLGLLAWLLRKPARPPFPG
ncbi:MAG TPA: prolipoprotein diacylglyceryl transferase family protein [Gemmataceae bacterium]|nr:prolipoprotein diacylglyceryl transferase family protein [Gemmataceae bacterium]